MARRRKWALLGKALVLLDDTAYYTCIVESKVVLLVAESLVDFREESVLSEFCHS